MSRCALLALGTISLSVASLSCAARAPRVSPAQIAELAGARSLLSAGCYRCLEEALSTFERLSAAKPAPAGAQRGAFDAAFLLALRAREIGLPDEPAIERARRWAAQEAHAVPQLPRVPKVPNAATTAIELLPANAYLDALPLFLGELSGYPQEERDRRSRARRAAWGNDGTTPAARAVLSPAVATDLVADYLSLALDCEDGMTRRQLKAEELLNRHDTPLMRFRIAMCGLSPEGARPVPNTPMTPAEMRRMNARFLEDAYAELRAADPRWIDTYFFEGRRELSKYPGPDFGQAAELLSAALEAFPDAASIALALGTTRNTLLEFEPALALFDRVLAVQPTHREALLGRIVSLSYLNRHHEAIASATQMIELGTYSMGDAYYWRAWNRYRVQLLPAAWEDVTQATHLMVNTSVYTLAGFIAYARQWLETAIDRLQQAYKMDASNCEAVWTEGLVHVDKEDWSVGAPRFVTAVRCFTNAAAEARREIAQHETATTAPATKTRLIGAAQKGLDTAEHRRAQSAFNAANCFVRLKLKAEALTHLDIAATHPLLKEKAAGLRTVIDKLP